MNIYVYSDESGVLDKAHNEYFVFGGLVFLDKEDRETMIRKYAAAEKNIRKGGRYVKKAELKASVIKAEDKRKLYRLLKGCYKFATVIEQKSVLDSIMSNKKSKQRFLDFAYKIGVKRLLQRLIAEGEIVPEEVQNIYFYVDEHTTATNGVYELKESLEEEFKNGIHNWNFSQFFPPIFPKMGAVELNYCNSETVTLVRAADIVANRIYHDVISGNSFQPFDIENNKLLITYLPKESSH